MLFSVQDLEDLRHAKELLEHPGLAVRLSAALGAPIERGLKKLPARWSDAVQSAVKVSLMRGLDVAVRTLDRHPRPSRNLLHKLMAAGAGTAGGLLGFASLPVELPVSTTIMLRSIADVARSEGEDLGSLETRLNCLEVFALGGGPNPPKDMAGGAAETGYFAIRSALAGYMTEAARHITQLGLAREGSPAVLRLVAAIAQRFGIVVTEKFAASAVPVIGAASCAMINLIFIDHFQNVARGHFIIRRLERTYGPEEVRRRFDAA